MDKSITIDMYIALLKQYLDSELRNNTDIIFNSITFKEQKNQYDNDNDKLRRDVVVRSGLPCKYCKSTETIYLEVQLTRGDNGINSVIKCFNCGKLNKS
jgi:DNA-directed RNA polymerase subunit M/transcription elongation factor TFIIS